MQFKTMVDTKKKKKFVGNKADPSNISHPSRAAR
jgi:hypothetical protein